MNVVGTKDITASENYDAISASRNIVKYTENVDDDGRSEDPAKGNALYINVRQVSHNSDD